MVHALKNRDFGLEKGFVQSFNKDQSCALPLVRMKAGPRISHLKIYTTPVCLSASSICVGRIFFPFHLSGPPILKRLPAQDIPHLHKQVP